MKKPALSRRLLFTIFTISGFSGLIYESIWSHYLKLFLGHAAYAQTLVLAIFMGGMALGAWLTARYTSKIRNLLVGYAVVELITGVLALIFHSVYNGATAVAFDSIIPALGSAETINAFKWTLGALLILPQSILLGSTFPLISGGVIRRFPEQSGETLAMLYFTNSLGAALGVLASGFVFIEAVGLPGTVMTAGIMNILLALFVWVLARDEDAQPKQAATTSAGSNPVVRVILVTAFCAGLASFVYEIAWIRMLSLVLGSSTHAFELMLSAFILGLALGGFWIRRRIAGFQSPLRALSFMFALMAVLAALTLPSYGFAFDVMSATMRMFTSTEMGYAGFNVISHAIAAAMMIPTTVVAGMTLPLMTHYLLHSGSGEAAIGKVYAANTVGAIVGVLLAIHFLLPNIGTKGAIITGALVQGTVSFLLLRAEAPANRSLFAMSSLGVSLAVVMLLAFTVNLDPTRMASGVYRHGFSKVTAGSSVYFLKDGKTATITLNKVGTKIAIATNGKPDAAINMGEGPAGPDEITMTMAGALPLFMKPDAKLVANIGVGSGLTSHVLLTVPTVEVVDSIEIEPAMVEAARIGFEPRVHRFFQDPRSKIHIEDAKTFFATEKKRYDVIVSEPSNPWVSGVASLFSEEFYDHIKRYIAPKGLLVQWVQIYETDVTIVASIAKALSPHFPDYAIYNTDDTNILIVASVDGPVPDLDPSMLKGDMQVELNKVGVDSVADMQLRRIGSKRSLDPLFASYNVPANSDYFPYVDLNAPRMRFLRRSAVALSEITRNQVPVMELLGEPALEPGAALSTSVHFYIRQDFVQRALNIRAALTTGDLAPLPPDMAADVLAVGTPVARCAVRGVDDAWFAAASTLIANTTPALSPADLQPVWQAIEASPCHATATAMQRQRLDFLRAVAMRDRDAIIAMGTATLQDRKTLPASARVEVLVAVSASLFGKGDPDGAVNLLKQDIDLIEEQRADSFALRLVEAIALAHNARSAGGRVAAQ